MGSPLKRADFASLPTRAGCRNRTAPSGRAGTITACAVQRKSRRSGGFAASGEPAAAIARRLGIPRATVRGWLNPTPRTPRPPRIADLSALPPAAYAYLLGLYLGDGHVVVDGPVVPPDDHARRGVPRDRGGRCRQPSPRSCRATRSPCARIRHSAAWRYPPTRSFGPNCSPSTARAASTRAPSG